MTGGATREHEAAGPPFRIRLARPGEIERLREIEDEAGTMFSGLGLIDEARDAPFPRDELARLVRLGQVWVGCLEDGIAVGMAAASARDGAAYLEEIDVVPRHGGRGLGTRLLACVCAWAGAHGHPAVTLSTFRDVPWNAPFYRKHGFRVVPPEAWTAELRAIREREARNGLRVDARVFMRRELRARRPAGLSALVRRIASPDGLDRDPAFTG